MPTPAEHFTLDNFQVGSAMQRIADANPGRVQAGGLIRTGVVLTLPEVWVPILDMLLALSSDPKSLRDFVVSLPPQDYQALWAGLTLEQKRLHVIFLQGVEMTHSSKMTMAELASEQLNFLKDKAKAVGKTVGQYLMGEADTRGYGGGEATRWNSLSPKEQADWKQRYNKMVQGLQTNAPADIREILSEARRRGGGMKFAPAEVEESSAFAYTQGDNTLYVGLDFVEVADKNLAAVYPNIAHELSGHQNYGGTEYGYVLIQEVLDLLPKAERDLANSSSNSLYSAYGYMETEIFAELYEHAYDSNLNPTDRPFGSNEDGQGDVPFNLKVIREVFAPKAAAALVRGLARRVQLDEFIRPGTKARFRQAVKKEYGFEVP